MHWYRAGFSPVLTLEIAEPGRPAEGHRRFASIDPADECWKQAVGAPRINGELLKLGFMVAESTAAKYGQQ